MEREIKITNSITISKDSIINILKTFLTLQPKKFSYIWFSDFLVECGGGNEREFVFPSLYLYNVTEKGVELVEMQVLAR